MKKNAVVIGRFQPFHRGHRAMFDKALEVAEFVYVVIGDHLGCRNAKNPWTVAERIAMIKANFTPAQRKRMCFVPQRDYVYGVEAMTMWLDDVEHVVSEKDAVLVGCLKDPATTKYLTSLNWTLVGVSPLPHGDETIHATNVRERFFVDGYPTSVSAATASWMHAWRRKNPSVYDNIRKEFAAIWRNRFDWQSEAVRKWGLPVQVAVDAFVFDPVTLHVLLIERGGNVGKGSWAMPGGFVDRGEDLITAALRELKEEAQIDVRRAHFGDHDPQCLSIYDSPSRSLRGRIVTTVMDVNCKCTHVNSTVKPVAGDNAVKAFWLPFERIKPNAGKFFSDHFHIIENMLFRKGVNL